VKVGGSARLQGSELQGPLLARLPDGSVALVDRCASGDEAAWRELHDTYRPVVVRFLRRMGLDAFEAADGAQEVFIQVHRYLWRFEGRSDLKTDARFATSPLRRQNRDALTEVLDGELRKTARAVAVALQKRANTK